MFAAPWIWQHLLSQKLLEEPGTFDPVSSPLGSLADTFNWQLRSPPEALPPPPLTQGTSSKASPQGPCLSVTPAAAKESAEGRADVSWGQGVLEP